MDSFFPFVYKKEKEAVPEQIQLELDVPMEKPSSSKDDDNDVPKIIIIDIL